MELTEKYPFFLKECELRFNLGYQKAIRNLAKMLGCSSYNLLHSKQNKLWLIDADDREINEMVANVWG